jgi:hypothetical protein
MPKDKQLPSQDPSDKEIIHQNKTTEEQQEVEEEGQEEDGQIERDEEGQEGEEEALELKKNRRRGCG